MSAFHPSALCAALLAAALQLAPAGCARDRALPGGELTPRVAAMLAHLPAAATVVGGINLERARGMRLYDKLSPGLPLPPEAAQIRETCALDPLHDIDLVVAALLEPISPDRMVIALGGRFTKDSVARCVAAIAARSAGRIAVAEAGALTVYSSADGKAYAYWPRADTVIVSPAAVGSPEVLAPLTAGGGAGANPELMSHVAMVKTGAALWVAGRMPAEARRRLASLGAGAPDVPGFFASVDGQGDRLDVLFGLRMAREEEARGTALGLGERQKNPSRSGLDPEVAAIVKRLEIQQSGRDVAIRASLTTAEVELLLEAAAGLGAAAAAK